MNKNHFLFSTLVVLAFITGSCKKTESVTPDLTFPETITSLEGSSQQVPVLIPVTLSAASDKQVSLTWTTTDGTAKAGEDYTAVTNSVLIFNPGETSKNIEVLIANDSLYESDETLFVTISNVKNANSTSYRTQVAITNDDAFNPTVNFATVTKVNEGTGTPLIAKVLVVLTPASNKTVNVNWSTKEGTAKSGSDFVAVSGATLAFAPGETQKTMEVQLVSDSILEFNESFSIVIDQVTNAAYTVSEPKVEISNDDSFTPEMVSDGYITPDTYTGMQLLWSDEFDGPTLNMSWWTYELGAGGWGNAELQTYTNSSTNSYINSGKLNIVAVNNYGNYTSARLITKGKKEFTYGRIDIRAKLPYGQGIWPALWMLGGNISQVGWPSCGEIDIMEYLGQNTKKVYGTAHYDNLGHQSSGGNYTLNTADGFNSMFHVFTIVWQESSITWYVDYKKYWEVTSSSIKYDSFKLPQFFIFNIAVGGNWPGPPNATTVFPQTMTVDYIRVFQPE